MEKYIQRILLEIFTHGVMSDKDLIYTFSGEHEHGNEMVSQYSIMVITYSINSWMTL